jgi:hypothetical protein
LTCDERFASFASSSAILASSSAVLDASVTFLVERVFFAGASLDM